MKCKNCGKDTRSHSVREGLICLEALSAEPEAQEPEQCKHTNLDFDGRCHSCGEVPSMIKAMKEPEPVNQIMAQESIDSQRIAELEAEVERLREWCTLRHTILHRVKGWCLEISDEVETFEDAVYLARKCLDQISQGEIVRPMEDKNAQ